jgi:hypothetical protein
MESAGATYQLNAGLRRQTGPPTLHLPVNRPTPEGVRRDFDELSAYRDGPVYGGGYLICGAGGAVIAVIIAVV